MADNGWVPKRPMTPGERVSAECARRGTKEVVSRCVDLLQARDVEDAFLLVLGGQPASAVLEGWNGGKQGYWPRVWAARGLLYSWDEDATIAVIAATGDTAWRVREMAAKVVARHHIGDAINAVAGLRTDPVPRVRAAAERAVRVLAEACA